MKNTRLNETFLVILSKKEPCLEEFFRAQILLA